MKSRTIRTVSSIAVTCALLMGGASMASAADSAGRAGDERHASSSSDSATKHRDHRATGSGLTDSQKAKAGTAAAKDRAATAKKDKYKAGSEGAHSGKRSGRNSATT